MEIVPCSAAIARTWHCMTTLLLAPAALVLLWLDGWPIRKCKWTTRSLSCRRLWNGVSSMFCRINRNRALYHYNVVGAGSTGVAGPCCRSLTYWAECKILLVLCIATFLGAALRSFQQIRVRWLAETGISRRIESRPQRRSSLDTQILTTSCST